MKIFKKIKRFVRRIYYKLTNKDNIFYVGSTDILPEPLSEEDENYYLELKEKGESIGKEKLIEHNLRLVVYLAKRYENTGVDLEDLVSIGSIGLIKGINTFNKDKKIKLATYISRCIDNEILMFLRKTKKIKQEISIEESLSYDSDGNELHLEDVIGTDKETIMKEIENHHDKKVMLEEILNLKPRDRDIMVLRYGLLGNEEYTQKEVADRLGISQSYISRIEKKVIKKLKVLVNN